MSLVSSLSNRIFLASAALAVLSISAAIYVVNGRVTAAVEDELRRELVQEGAVVDQQRANVGDLFAVFARTVADLPKLKAAIATDDPPTVQPIAAEYARAVGANLLLVTNGRGGVLAQQYESALPEPALALPSLDGARAGRETAAFCVFSEGVLQVVSVPVAAGASPPEIVGTLSLGFLLDDALAARFKALTGSEIAFAAGSRVLASTLPEAERAALVPVAAARGIVRARAGDVDYLALVQPLASPTPAPVLGSHAALPAVAARQAGDATEPVTIILRSRTERLRLLQPIRAALLGTGAVAVLLAVVLGYAIARTVTRPLAVITDTMKQMAATGDLARKIAWRPSRWRDEDAQILATTFNTLTDSIARFQRQAAERERLSALGRLSTVIAHEVRNPLMIIKGSLRPLYRSGPSAEEVREAAADIDEEVGRLNRLVNDVLDFARPLRFDLAPADVNAVCRQSADAASSGEDRAIPIACRLDASVRPIVTDAERLRSALVNLLLNARQAVAARNDAPARDLRSPACGDEAPVEIETRPIDGGRVAVEIRDRGVGIDPADLGRVFEPYFTTRRAGSGLGLAISRNIIEGLGGSIRVTSQPGVGTVVRIELADAPRGGPGTSDGQAT